MLRKVEGIVIRTRDYGESHKVVVLLTRERGKIAVMARGAKKPKSRLGAATQPFTRGIYLFFEGSGMASLSQGDILDSHHRIRSDLLLTSYVAYLTELLDKMIPEAEPVPALYALLQSTMEHLEKGADPDILARIFELKIMDAAGYRPVLDGCAVCRTANRPVRFSILQGGLLCSECWDRDPKALPISLPAARILKLLQRITPDRLGSVRVKPETKQQLERVTTAFLDEYADVRLKSRIFLDQLRNDWKPD